MMTKLFEARRQEEEQNSVWLVRWMLGGFFTILLAIAAAWAGGVGTSLQAHQRQLEENAQRIAVQENTSSNIEKKLDNIILELREIRQDARKR